MRPAWRRLWVGLKIAFGVAVKLNDAGVIRVKELDKATPILDAIKRTTDEHKTP